MFKKKAESRLEMWVADLLMEARAIAPCPDYGYMRLQHSHRAVDCALGSQSIVSFPARTRRNGGLLSSECSTASPTSVLLALD